MSGDGRALHFFEKELDYLHASARSYDAKAQIASVGWARAIDGDTLVVGSIRVRLQGVAAPEIAHQGQAEPEPGGPAAFLARLVNGRTEGAQAQATTSGGRGRCCGCFNDC